MFNMFNDIESLSIQGGVPPPYPPPTGIYILSDIKGLAAGLIHTTHTEKNSEILGTPQKITSKNFEIMV